MFSIFKKNKTNSLLRAARSGNEEKVLQILNSNLNVNSTDSTGLTALHLASKQGHVSIVEKLLKRGADVAACTKKKNTSLHLASLAGKLQVLKLLISHGADVNVAAKDGFTALYMACQEGHVEVVEELLLSKADATIKTDSGSTALSVAVDQGHVLVAKLLLEKGWTNRHNFSALHVTARNSDIALSKLLLSNKQFVDVNQVSWSGFTALHMCSHYGNLPLAQMLIQNAADVNIKAKNDITSLHVASKQGHLVICKLLLDNGANLHATTLDGLTALHCAAKNKRNSVLKELLARRANIEACSKHHMRPLHCAVQADCVHSCQALLDHKADINACTVDKLTPLHIAAHFGHIKSCRVLLLRKCLVDPKTTNGFTPLHVAIKRGKWKVVELLIRHNADVSALTCSGLSALHLSCLNACPFITSFLLQGGESAIEGRTGRGETALHIASCCGQLESTQTLLAHGAQVDARAHDLKHTPLHLAAEKGHEQIVKTLLKSGANPNALITTLLTPLHLASAKNHPACVSVLLDHGADPLLIDKRGHSSMHTAVKHNNVEVLRLLLQRSHENNKNDKCMHPQHIAALYNQLDCLNLLLEHYASPDLSTKDGFTALHMAAHEGRNNAALCLLNNKANPNFPSQKQVRPLHLACKAGHTQLSQLLIKRGADVNALTSNGSSVLHYAALSNNKKLIPLLKKAAVSMDCRDQYGNTPLHLACFHGNDDVVEALLQNGADANAKNQWGVGGLHYCAQRGDMKSTNHLLNNGAETNILDSTGWSPLCLSQKLDHQQLARLLLPLTSDQFLYPPAEHSTKGLLSPYGEARVLPCELDGVAWLKSSSLLGDEQISNETLNAVDEDEVTYIRDGKMPLLVKEKPEIENFVSQTRSRPQSSYSNRANSPSFNNFLVSFMVDARGGVMQGQRQHGVCLKVPPGSASAPVRITCKFVTPESILQPPRLREDEALACRLVEVGPANQKFSRPISIRIPHHACLESRCLQILRCDESSKWVTHTPTPPITNDPLPADVQGFFGEETFDADEDTQSVVIKTLQLPRYFALVSIPNATKGNATAKKGGVITSKENSNVQLILPEGAVKKDTSLELRVLPVSNEHAEDLGLLCGPVVSITPRSRKFHVPITIKLPLPSSRPSANNYQDRLLCSLSGEYATSKWEDITDVTSIKNVHDCAVFLTTASARYWMIRVNKNHVKELPQLASKIYHHSMAVPFYANVLVLGKIMKDYCGMRVYCVTSDRVDRVRVANHEMGYEELGSFFNVKVYENRAMFLMVEGGLQLASQNFTNASIQPTFNHLSQTTLIFHSLRENRLPVKVVAINPKCSKLIFCRLANVPATTSTDISTKATKEILCTVSLEEIHFQVLPSVQGVTQNVEEHISKAELRLTDIADALDVDWILLALQLGLSSNDVNAIQSEYSYLPEQALVMLHTWVERKKQHATGNALERALKVVGREDVLSKCMYNIRQVTDQGEMAVAKEYLDAAYNTHDYLQSKSNHSRASSVFRAPSSDRSYILDRSSLKGDSESEAVSLLGNDFLDKKGGLGYIDSASFRTGSEMEIRPSVEVCELATGLEYEVEEKWKDGKWSFVKRNETEDLETKARNNAKQSFERFLPDEVTENIIDENIEKLRKVEERRIDEFERKRPRKLEQDDRESTPVFIYLDDEQFKRTVKNEEKQEEVDHFEDENGLVVKCDGIRYYKTETIEVVKPLLEKETVGGKVIESRKEVVIAEEVTEEITDIPNDMKNLEDFEKIVSVSQSEDVLPNGLRLSRKVVKTRYAKKMSPNKGLDLLDCLFSASTQPSKQLNGHSFIHSSFQPSMQPNEFAVLADSGVVNEETIVPSENQKCRSIALSQRVISGNMNKEDDHVLVVEDLTKRLQNLKQKIVAVEEKEAKEDGSVVLYKTQTSNITRPIFKKILKEDQTLVEIEKEELIEKLIEQEIIELPRGMSCQEASSNSLLKKELVEEEEYEEKENNIIVNRKIKRMIVKKPVSEDPIQPKQISKKKILPISLEQKVEPPNEKQLELPETLEGFKSQEFPQNQKREEIYQKSENDKLKQNKMAIEKSILSENCEKLNCEMENTDELQLTTMTRSLIETDKAQTPKTQNSSFASAKKHHLPIETEVLGVQEWEEIIENGKKKKIKVITKKKSKPIAIIDKDKNGIEIERIIGKDKVGIEVEEEITEMREGLNFHKENMQKITTFENFEKQGEDGTWIRKKIKKTEIKTPPTSLSEDSNHPHSLQKFEDTLQANRSPNKLILRQQQEFLYKQQKEGNLPKITEGSRSLYNHPIYGQVTLTSYVEEPGVDEREEEGADGSKLKYRIITKMHKEKVSVIKEGQEEIILETNNLGTEIEEYIEEVEKGLEEEVEGVEKVTSVEETTDEMGEWGWLKRKVVYVKIYKKTDQNTCTVVPENIKSTVNQPYSFATSSVVGNEEKASLVQVSSQNQCFKTEKQVDQNEYKEDSGNFVLVSEEKVQNKNLKILHKKPPNPVLEKVLGEDGFEKEIMVSGLVEEFSESDPHAPKDGRTRIEQYYELLPDNTWVRKKRVTKLVDVDSNKPSNISLETATKQENLVQNMHLMDFEMKDEGFKSSFKAKSLESSNFSKVNEKIDTMISVEEELEKEEKLDKKEFIIALKLEDSKDSQIEEKKLEGEERKASLTSNFLTSKHLQELNKKFETFNSVEEQEIDESSKVESDNKTIPKDVSSTEKINLANQKVPETNDKPLKELRKATNESLESKPIIEETAITVTPRDALVGKKQKQVALGENNLVEKITLQNFPTPTGDEKFFFSEENTQKNCIGVKNNQAILNQKREKTPIGAIHTEASNDLQSYVDNLLIKTTESALAFLELEKKNKINHVNGLMQEKKIDETIGKKVAEIGTLVPAKAVKNAGVKPEETHNLGNTTKPFDVWKQKDNVFECFEEPIVKESTNISPCGTKSIHKRISTQKCYEDKIYKGKFIEENVFESSLDIKDPYAADVETETSIEEYVEKDENGDWVKRRITTVKAYLNQDALDSPDMETLQETPTEDQDFELEPYLHHHNVKVENVKERVLRKYPAKRTLADEKKLFPDEDNGKKNKGSKKFSSQFENNQQNKCFQNSLQKRWPPSQNQLGKKYGDLEDLSCLEENDLNDNLNAENEASEQIGKNALIKQNSAINSLGENKIDESNFDKILQNGTATKVGNPPSFIVPKKIESNSHSLPQTPKQSNKFVRNRVRRVVTRKIRRVLHNGEVVEDVVSEELPELDPSESTLSEILSQVSETPPRSRTSFASSHGIASLNRRKSESSLTKFYTDTLEGEPEKKTDVKETEQTLADGRVVTHKCVKTTEKQKIVKRLVMEDEDFANDFESAVQDDDDDPINYVLQKYVDTFQSNPTKSQKGTYLDEWLKQPEVALPEENCRTQYKTKFRVSMERDAGLNDFR